VPVLQTGQLPCIFIYSKNGERKDNGKGRLRVSAREGKAAREK
jgi:hypothetical protein